MGLSILKLILLLFFHAEILSCRYPQKHLVLEVLVGELMTRKVKVEEVMQNVNIVAKNMRRIKVGIKIKIKIKIKQSVTENQVSQISRVNSVSLANVAIHHSNQQCVQMNTFPSPRECAELCCVSKG